MRLEIHLFLWVTAALAIPWQLSGGISLPQPVSFDQQKVLAQLVAPALDNSKRELKSKPADDRAVTVIYDVSVRPMFFVAAVETPVPQGVPTVEFGSPPVLKGVLSGSGGWRAVFSREPGASDLVTVSPGETVADYRVRQVGEDFVTAISPAGEEVRFELRGAGEGQ